MPISPMVRYGAVQAADEESTPRRARYVVLGVGIFVMIAMALVVALTGGSKKQGQPQPLIPDLFPHTPITRTESISATPSTEVSSLPPEPTTSTTTTAETTTTPQNPAPKPAAQPPPATPPATFRAGPRAPQARISHSCSRRTCAFDAGGSSARDGSLVTYGWSFGDGSSGSGVRTSHTYLAPGTYTVWLVVADSSGKLDYASTQVSVS